MTEIQRVDVQGGDTVFKAEIWTEHATYIFAFEYGFYSCHKCGVDVRHGKPEQHEVVETGTESGLEELEIMNIAEFCKGKVEQYEEEAEV